MMPPLPLEVRLVLGLLGTLFAGILNILFRSVMPRWWEIPLAFVISPSLILLLSLPGGLDSGQRTESVFCGAIVGIACIRGSRLGRPISNFVSRAVIVFVAFVIL